MASIAKMKASVVNSSFVIASPEATRPRLIVAKKQACRIVISLQARIETHISM